LSSTVGGEYKIEVLNVNGTAKAFCLVKDASGHVASVRAPIKVGTSQTIACAKSSTGITIQVGGGSIRSKTNSAGIGQVGNDGQLFLGAKSASGGDDFRGTMSDAYVR
jgi:hypothetical protein